MSQNIPAFANEAGLNAYMPISMGKMTSNHWILGSPTSDKPTHIGGMYQKHWAKGNIFWCCTTSSSGVQVYLKLDFNHYLLAWLGACIIHWSRFVFFSPTRNHWGILGMSQECRICHRLSHAEGTSRVVWEIESPHTHWPNDIQFGRHSKHVKTIIIPNHFFIRTIW